MNGYDTTMTPGFLFAGDGMTARHPIARSAVASLCLLAGCSTRPAGPPGESFDAGPTFAARTPVVKHTFQVTNTTGRTVRILDESHTCTCTKVDLERRTLKPGETVGLTMTVNVPQGYSKLDLGSAVQTDHPGFPVWRYQLRFESFPTVRIVPDRINLGSIDSGGSGGQGEAHVEVYAPAGADLPRLKGVTAGEGVTAVLGRDPTFDVLENGVRRARYPVEIALDGAPRSDGLSYRELTVGTASGLPASAMIVWSCTLPVRCSPPQVHFGMVAAGDLPKAADVLIASPGGVAFKVKSSDGGSDLVRVDDLDAGNETSSKHRIKLTLSALGAEPSQALSGSVRLRTDLPEMPEVLVPWSAFPRRAGEGLQGTNAAVSPDSEGSQR